ncbi:MAG TPA: hypothetical protein VGH03_18800 [Caulobacteraceae bacterium]
MRRIPFKTAAATCAWLATASASWGQPAPNAPPADRIAPLVVTPAPGLSGGELQKAADGFVQARTVATRIGRLARWRVPICPVVDGLPPDMNAAIAGRVRQIATAAGVPVAPPGCSPNNVEIEFTAHPQALFSMAQKHNWILSGFHYASQDRQIAEVTRPIQAWYVTATRSTAIGTAEAATAIGGGMNGATFQVTAGHDQVNGGPVGVAVIDDPLGRTPGEEPGSRLNDSLSSEFANVLVIIDQTKVAGASTQAIADYVAVMALTQVADLDDCNALPSVLDLMARGCSPARSPEMLTASDLSYLQALYGTETRLPVSYSRGAIASHLTQALETR